MNKMLKEQMTRDLSMVKFADETDQEYNQRLIFSAAAFWVQTLLYGHSMSDMGKEFQYASVDIMYVRTCLEKVVSAYLEIFSVNSTWLEHKNQSSSIAGYFTACVIDELLYTYDIAEINSRRLTPVPYKVVEWDIGKYQLFGNYQLHKGAFFVGVSQWVQSIKDESVEVMKAVIHISVPDYMEFIKKSFRWKSAKLQAEYLRFIPGSIGGYSKCWKRVELSGIPQGISVLKLADEFNGGYFLVKKMYENIEICDLDPWYLSTKELYRILLAVNYANGTPAVFKVEDRKGFKVLHYSTAIPEFENRTIISCSWPYGNCSSRYHRIVPDNLWELVEKKLDYLGIKRTRG